MKTTGTITLIALMLVACEPPVEMLVEVYTIKSGEHFAAQRKVEALQSTVLQFDAWFDETARYQFDDAAFQDSKNKLLGFADCNSLHHDNSARFAWQWYNNRIEIYAYCYSGGERLEAFLGTVEPGEHARYRIELTRDHYVFHFKGEQTLIPRGNTCDTGTYFMLWPYFGGQLPAPHDVHIYIRRF